MTSACVCHTDEWCFYCNIHTPLDRQHSELRWGIVRVIAEMETRRKIHATDSSFIASAELEYFINKFKEVLSNHPPEQTKPIRSEED